jgi:photosystem II stability/assembly factor-like uncharacterized protein
MLPLRRITLLAALTVATAAILGDQAPAPRSGLGGEPAATAASPHDRASEPGLGPEDKAAEEPGPYPSDWFGMQRAFPGTTIPQGKFRAALEQARVDRVLNQVDRALTETGASAAAALVWTQAGPLNIGGRVTALAPVRGGSTVYLGSANGGVFKSTNSGVNWTPVFDDNGIYSIGALALDPADSNVVYVGTGEANASVDSYDGDGLFRTRDGGQSWEHLGLETTARIARVAVDPQNSDRIFVAAMGAQFSTGPDRGLYRSEDAGASWTRVLFVNDSTGASDVAFNPAHPETVFCATWERIRRPSYRRAFGPDCGIWRSADHGTTWTRLQSGLPAPSDTVGRIALAIAASRPSTIYAQIVSGSNLGYQGLGMYRSDNGGQSWTRRDAGTAFTDDFGGFAWYFGDVAVDPADPERVFAMGVGLIRSNDGGVTFASADTNDSTHPDQHALWIDPSNPARIYLGNDGGFFSSATGGSSWTKSVDLPITQFYAGAVDPSNPARLLGGTQDNFTLLTAGSPSAWSPILGGDGFYCLVDPTSPSTLFAEWQNCCSNTGPRRSTNAGGSWSAPSGFDIGDRYNWNTPIAMDPSNHLVLLVGSHRVYKSTNNGVSYAAISGDLSTHPPSLLTYGTITTLAISPVNSAVYYAGTDDGKVWRSLNSGGAWTDISAGLPRRWVTRVTPDPFAQGTVYVTLSGFGLDEHLPHVYRSTDSGTNWVSISGNLPDAPANDILVDPSNPQTLYLATDLGVYATLNLGAGWFPLGRGMPIQTVFDLTFHAPSRTLVAATHGRSQWKLDLNAPLAVALEPSLAHLAMSSPAPNPTRSAVHLELEVSRATAVEVEVYDTSGRRVRTLVHGALEAGRHALSWDGRDAQGHRIGPGVFFVRAHGAGAVATRRLVRVD